MRADGWHPTPIHDLILKVHQRCNLACDYCFVYTQADQTWRDRPAVMPDEVWRAAVASLGRHVRRHRLSGVRVILHGGEPLLYGVSRLGLLASELRAEMPAGCKVHIGLQTNGVLLNEKVIGSLRQHRIMVGVSVDGVEADHDRHRVGPNGRGSFAAVRDAIDLLRRPENRSIYGGLLCTVAPETDPIACYEQLRAFEPPMIDFLLPHANWERPPRRPAGTTTPYADWLVRVFDRWYDESDAISVRLFEDIITLLLGGGGQSEQVGLSPSAMVVVESDGAIEQVDSLKSAYDGACATGLNILHDDLDAALEDHGIVARQIGRAALSAHCLQCPVHQVCGAGHYVHRYRPGSGFRNPSVYCEDMRILIGHIRDRVAAEIRQRETEVVEAR
ncbi:FxsB family cyclophane-forming radical SAM/SPASM peptide maturase [Allorhizocola rhizosphaerae]|uniref:FxsB family cyclophane-forming radical SAM/SPASM peptide maturase n=1 Tax=Allorhizocola rhizosphaerae TaxID=1872709 RepID=UPI001FEB26F2|nr:FxsB family cyclophane-forming radical SAM/SPASM peptide maturase [Allorhizocola rhizosphaerae]